MSVFRAGSRRTFVLLLAAFHLAAFYSDVARRAHAAEPVRILQDVPYKSGELSDYERERCKLDFYLPSAATDFATIVWFHGGGLQNGDKAGAAQVAMGRRFAARGVAVASVNYRLSPRATFPAYVDDAAAAFAFVRRVIGEHGGSPDQVFVSGHSAGGYLTAMIGFDPSYLARYAVKPGDVAGLMPVSGQMITHSTVRKERQIPETRPIIDSAAPAFHVYGEAPACLAIAGGRDLPARAEENRYFIAALHAAGHQNSSYLEVPDRNHSSIAGRLGEPDDAVTQAMLAFIKRKVESR